MSTPSRSAPDRPSRRAFLAGSAMALALPAARPRMAATFRTGLDILVLGGTRFLGPAVVRSALARGHKLTLWNRGRTHPELFPEVEKLRGQRRRPRKAGDPAQDLGALQGRKWDAVVDTSGYFKGEVEDTANLLAPNIKHYTFVSSLSVYRDLEQNDQPIDEHSALCEIADPDTLEMGKDFANYGALKRYGEDAVHKALPGGAFAVRPGYIVGPEDTSNRFAYWPARLVRGGECLAPGAMDNELQFVDVRDLGEFIVRAIEQHVTGPCNAVGFRGRISTAEFLHCGKGTLNDTCSFTWVDDDFLVAEGIGAWVQMPCWTPRNKNGHASNRKALDAGLACRPIAQTIADTAAWVQQELPKDHRFGACIDAAAEQALLAKWRARK